MSSHQAKELTELAFATFTAYMKDQALQLLKTSVQWREVSLPCAEIETEASGTCRELKDFFHGTRLPSVLANEITKRLLRKLDMFSEIYKSAKEDYYFQQVLFTVVELFMHPDVTSIELGPGYLFEFGYAYCYFIVKAVIKKVSSLHNLKTLNLGLGLFDDKLVLPSQLKELALCSSSCLKNDQLKNIVECCRELKSLKVVKFSIVDISVPEILQLNRLEILHLLGDFEDCATLINGISSDGSSEVLSASTLKSIGVTVIHENTLHLIVDKLPHLTEIVLEPWGEFDLSCLTQLKNLRSLTLDPRSLTLDPRDRASSDYKKILPVLGKNLVCLELRGYKSLDLEFIGETCSNLRCLHVDATANSAARAKPSFKTFPNFRTVECLRVYMPYDPDWIEFIIVQCLNIKVLSVLLPHGRTIIENVLKRTNLTNLEEIHWCRLGRGEITDNVFLEELCLKCPNLHLVHGIGCDSFVSRRVVFDFNGCRKCFCESWCYLMGMHEYLFYCEDDSEDELLGIQNSF